MNESDAQVKLCMEVLRRLGKAGVLDNVLLVGSWCTYFYREALDEKWDIGPLRTGDMDIFVPNPNKQVGKVDIIGILDGLDFISEMRGGWIHQDNRP